MEEFIQFTSIPAVTVTVFLLAQCLKAIFPDVKRALPAICGIAGMVISIVCKLTITEFMQGDILTTAATGIVSGFAATGVHQLGNLIKVPVIKEDGQEEYHNESGGEE